MKRVTLVVDVEDEKKASWIKRSLEKGTKVHGVTVVSMADDDIITLFIESQEEMQAYLDEIESSGLNDMSPRESPEMFEKLSDADIFPFGKKGNDRIPKC